RFVDLVLDERLRRRLRARPRAPWSCPTRDRARTDLVPILRTRSIEVGNNIRCEGVPVQLEHPGRLRRIALRAGDHEQRRTRNGQHREKQPAISLRAPRFAKESVCHLDPLLSPWMTLPGAPFWTPPHGCPEADATFPHRPHPFPQGGVSRSLVTEPSN